MSGRVRDLTAIVALAALTPSIAGTATALPVGQLPPHGSVFGSPGPDLGPEHPRWSLDHLGIDPSIAGLDAISCSSVGNCSAGGSFHDRTGLAHAFVVDEVNGTWGHIQEVKPSLNFTFGSPVVTAISCSSAGNCSAGGEYQNGVPSGIFVLSQAFVVDEVSGVWGLAEEVPGSGVLNAGGQAIVSSISCRSAGSCSAGGSYLDSSDQEQSFVVEMSGGVWGAAQEAPGTAALDGPGYSNVEAISCVTAGNCTATGNYNVSPQNVLAGGPVGEQQVYLIDEVNGIWGTAEEVPGTAALNVGGWADMGSISCSSVGTCSGGGSYSGPTGDVPFVIDEVGGTWGTAKALAGTEALGFGPVFADLEALSCSSAGNCSAAGSYATDERDSRVFVANEVGGTWGPVEEVPGTSKQFPQNDATMDALSCSAAGRCSAVGSYSNLLSGYQQAFVVDEVGGVWGPAQDLKGTATVGGASHLNVIACASPESCSAAGTGSKPFAPRDTPIVVDRASGGWGSAQTLVGLTPPAAPHVTSVIAGIGSLSVFWSQPADNGDPISSYTLRLEPGNRSCVTTATRCTVGSLQARQRYVVGVTASNGAPMTGPPSQAVWAYPEAAHVPRFWPTPLVTSALTPLQVGVIGGRPGALATISVPRSGSGVCRFSVAGQCTSTLHDPHTGAWTVTGASGGHTWRGTLYVVGLEVSSRVKLGRAARVTFTSCPPGSIVRVQTSIRIYSARASASGLARVSVPTHQAGQWLITAFVAGVNVGNLHFLVQ